MKKLLLVALVGSSVSAYAAQRPRFPHHPGVTAVHGEKAVAIFDALNVAIDTKETPKGTLEMKKVGTLLCGRLTKKAEGETPVEGEVKYGCAMAGMMLPPPPHGNDHDNDHDDDDCTGNDDQGPGNGNQGGDQGPGNGNQGGDQGTGGAEQILEILSAH